MVVIGVPLNKPSMVLDLIEEFRPILVDRAIVTLFAQKQINKRFFEMENETKQLLLTKKGREKIISAVMKRLHQKITFKKNKLSFQNILLAQARSIANTILNNKKFEPFIYRW